MLIGIDTGNWASAAASADAVGFDTVRFSKQEDSFSRLTEARGKGLKAILLWTAYTTGGVKAIASGEPSACVAWYQANGCNVSNTPYIEWCNEPFGSWFWGSGANSQANRDAYAGQIKALRTALNNAGLSAVGILASYDNAASAAGWGPGWRDSSVNTNAMASTTYVTIHPYVGSQWQNGPSSHDNLSISGVLSAISSSGKNCFPTECGIPTGPAPSSDSPNVSQAGQATVLTNFIQWASDHGLPGLVIYNYRNAHDSTDGHASETQQYGYQLHDGTPKSSQAAIQSKIASLGGGGGGGGTVSQVTIALDAGDHSRVTIANVDPSTATLHFATSSDSGGVTSKFFDVGASATTFTPPDPAFPYVNVAALDGSGNIIGTWFDQSAGGSRILTTPGTVAAIAYVGERGAGTADPSGTTTNTLSVASDFSTGNTAILEFACRNTSTAGAAVTDSRGNTWTIDAPAQNTGNNCVLIASTRMNLGRLVTGDTITVTFTTAPSTCVDWLLEEFSGLITSSYVDKQTHGENAGAVTSGTSGTTTATAQAAELAVAAFCLNVATGFTKDATYAAFTTSAVELSGARKALAGCYKILSATGTQVCSVTWTGTASSYQGLIVTYKAAGTSTADVPTVTTDSSQTAVSGGVLAQGTPTLGNQASAQGSFEYGATTAYGHSTTAKLVTGVFTDTIPAAPGATIHYRAVISNAGGIARGVDRTYVAPVSQQGAPSIFAVEVTDLTQDTATLSISVDPGGGNAGLHVRYGQTLSYGQQFPTSQDVSVTTVRTIVLTLSGLASDDDYFALVEISNVIDSASFPISFHTEVDSGVPAARTRIPVGSITRAGTGPATQVVGDPVNGHEISSNDGRTFLEIMNGDTGAHTVTINPYRAVDGLQLEPVQIVVPPLDSRRSGALHRSTFNQPSGRVQVDVDSDALLLRAYQLAR